MNEAWEQLAGNFAFVGLAFCMWAHALVWFRRTLAGYEKFLLGIVAGATAVGSILLAVEIRPGTYIDLRYAAVIIAFMFAGPITAIIVALSVAIFQFLVGGAVDGAFMVAVIAGIGAIAKLVAAARLPSRLKVVLAIAATCATMIVSMFLPLMGRLYELASANLAVAVLNCSAATIWWFIILKTQQFQLERSILITAFSQAPDYLYVKDRNSRFVTVNQNMVRLHRRETTDEMVGLSDFDTMTRNRAEEFYCGEQEVMRTGTPLVDSFEQIEERYYLASKVPLRNSEGTVIGLAGVTRDITERTALERELRENKNLMTYAMEGMSDGFAIFDDRGFLLFCNEQYRNAFPLSADARVVGANIRDILRRVVETRERVDVPYEASEAWIEAASAILHRNKDEEVELPNGDWRSLKTRVAEEGMALVVVSDITARKQAELALRLSAERMKALAETDPLTGTLNRRAFDEAFARAATHSDCNSIHLSLLMIDVDRFKAYNDTYGHPAGDRCLREVSACLLRSVGRSTGIVARYGGEEFVVLLPETSPDDASIVAERFVRHLGQENIVHAGSEFGRVTASIGIASGRGPLLRREPTRLLAAADNALYQAKSGGRNRIVSSPIVAVRKTG